MHREARRASASCREASKRNQACNQACNQRYSQTGKRYAPRRRHTLTHTYTCTLHVAVHVRDTHHAVAAREDARPLWRCEGGGDGGHPPRPMPTGRHQAHPHEIGLALGQLAQQHPALHHPRASGRAEPAAAVLAAALAAATLTVASSASAVAATSIAVAAAAIAAVDIAAPLQLVVSDPRCFNPHRQLRCTSK